MVNEISPGVGGTPPGKNFSKGTFAAGCFWGVEMAFRCLKGVVATRVGYTGGTFENPRYEDVCSGKTGHAEAVEVTYDPKVISYGDLSREFFRIHDPTTPDRQGPDMGTQYRSAIFYHNEEQRATAEAVIEEVRKSGKFHRPIVTQVVPALKFYEAEGYHQQYFEKNRRASCHIR